MPLQDIEFTIDQLVEIAVRSLSPGINDPFTAVQCIDYLSAALGNIATRPLPDCCLVDDEGRVRVVERTVSFESLIAAALHQIRQYGCGSPAVLIRMMEALTPLVSVAHRTEDIAALAEHGNLIRDAGQANFAAEYDRRDLDERFQTLQRRISEKQPAS
jgi:uncharacterized membrane protein